MQASGGKGGCKWRRLPSPPPDPRRSAKTMLDEQDPYLKELTEFRGSERFHSLRKRFWGSPSLANSGILPVWDDRESAKHLNWELTDDEQSELQLYPVQLEALRRCIFMPSAYSHPGIYQHAAEDQFLRIIDRWLQGIRLPLPVLTTTKDGSIGKRDGYHRLVVSYLVGADTIPCWILGSTAMQILQSNE